MKLYIENSPDSEEIFKRIGLFICIFSNIENFLSKYLSSKGINSSHLRFSGKVNEIKRILGKENSLIKKLEHSSFKNMREKISHSPIVTDMHAKNAPLRFGLKKENRTYLSIGSLDKSIAFSRDLLVEVFCLNLEVPKEEIENFKVSLKGMSFGFSDGRC